MAKVYVVLKVSVIDGDETITILGTYSKRVDAKKTFDNEVSKEKKTWLWDEDSAAFDDFTDTDTEFCCWEDGYFCHNHVSISIKEQEIK